MILFFCYLFESCFRFVVGLKKDFYNGQTTEKFRCNVKVIIIFESICKLLKASHIYDLSQQIFMYLLIQTFKMMQNTIIFLQVGKLNNVSRVMPFRSTTDLNIPLFPVLPNTSKFLTIIHPYLESYISIFILELVLDLQIKSSVKDCVSSKMFFLKKIILWSFLYSVVFFKSQCL